MDIEDLPSSVFPNKADPDNICLVGLCGESQRRFSWFCCSECELVFVERNSG